MKTENIEKRFLNIEFRATEDENGDKFIEGIAAPYESRSKLIMEMGEIFYETISIGAFRDVLEAKPDVYLTFNHSRDMAIARTVNGSLSLTEDDEGLKFRAKVPNVSYANDVYELVKNGTYFENSFAFAVDNEGFRWEETDEGVPLRIITNIRKLVDVSIVLNGAYADTEVAARELKEHRDSKEAETQPVVETEDEPVVEPETKKSEQERMKMKIKI